jgi:hypothetical protein
MARFLYKFLLGKPRTIRFLHKLLLEKPKTTRFLFKLLLGEWRIKEKTIIGGSLAFLGYTTYDHMYPQSTAPEKHYGNPYNFTTSKIASTDIYPKLSDPRSIRLIKLYGAEKPDDNIYVDLVTASIYKPPLYDAISYAWEGQPKDQIIYVNGQKFLITKNAQDVIQQLRPKPGEFRFLWVDAICINQKDNAEKSSQVSIMVEIYKKAAQVNIWLGIGNDTSDFILKWYRLITLPLAPVLWIERKAMGVYSQDYTPTDVLFLLVLCSFSIAASKDAAFFLGHNVFDSLRVLEGCLSPPILPPMYTDLGIKA